MSLTITHCLISNYIDELLVSSGGSAYLELLDYERSLDVFLNNPFYSRTDDIFQNAREVGEEGDPTASGHASGLDDPDVVVVK